MSNWSSAEKSNETKRINQSSLRTHYDSDFGDQSGSHSHYKKTYGSIEIPPKDQSSNFIKDNSNEDFESILKFDKMMKTGRQRKKIAARIKGGEFMSKRKKRRVYFCCIASEINVEGLHELFQVSYLNMTSTLYDEVLCLTMSKNTSSEHLNQETEGHSSYSIDDQDHEKETEDYNNQLYDDIIFRRTHSLDRSNNSSSPTRADSKYRSQSLDLSVDGLKLTTDQGTAGYLWIHNRKEIYIFNFGAIVFWGFHKDEEKIILAEIHKYIQKGPLSDEEFHDCADDMAFLVSSEESTISIANDVITYPEDSNIKSRLSVSFAIAQSAILAVYEARIECKIADYRYIPQTLASSGRIKLSPKKLGNMIGDVFVIRHEINLNSEILNTPDFFWRLDEEATIYRMSMKYLEMETRIEVLNTRLNMLKDLLEVLQHQYDNSHGVYLEWIVIWLIGISVGLEIYTIYKQLS